MAGIQPSLMRYAYARTSPGRAAMPAVRAACHAVRPFFRPALHRVARLRYAVAPASSARGAGTIWYYTPVFATYRASEMARSLMSKEVVRTS